jgi:hypothetical protein
MSTSNAAYIGFTRALAKMFSDAGIEYQQDKSTETGIVENAKWVDFQFRLGDGQLHKLYVPKNKGAISKLHTTIYFDSRIEGVLELPSTEKRPEYRNGLIQSHLSGADPQRVAALVIAAIRRGAPVPQKRIAQSRTPQQQPARGGMPQSQPQDAGAGVSEVRNENWSLTENDIAQADAEVMQTIEQH